MTQAQIRQHLKRQAYLRRKPGTLQYRRAQTARRRIAEKRRRFGHA